MTLVRPMRNELLEFDYDAHNGWVDLRVGTRDAWRENTFQTEARFCREDVQDALLATRWVAVADDDCLRLVADVSVDTLGEVVCRMMSYFSGSDGVCALLLISIATNPGVPPGKEM